MFALFQQLNVLILNAVAVGSGVVDCFCIALLSYSVSSSLDRCRNSENIRKHNYVSFFFWTQRIYCECIGNAGNVEIIILRLSFMA